MSRARGRPGLIAVNLGLGAALAAVQALTVVALATNWGDLSWLPDLVCGLLVGVLALLPGRRLVWAALAIAGTAAVVARLAEFPRAPGPATVLALAVLVGSAVRSQPVRGAVTVAAGGLLVAVVTQFSGPPSPSVVGALNAGGWGAAVAGGLVLRLVDVTRAVTEERARRDERLTLARELHDVAAHHLTGIVLLTQAARRRPSRLEESLDDLEGAGTEALTAIRRVVGLLRSPASPDRLEDLASLVRRFDRVPVRLTLPDAAAMAGWPPEVASTVHRVVQESLTNVARHSPGASIVSVRCVQEASLVRLVVTDDGPPAGSPRRGFGLAGMRERVEALGGTFAAGPGDGPGWSVRATLPLG